MGFGVSGLGRFKVRGLGVEAFGVSGLGFQVLRGPEVWAITLGPLLYNEGPHFGCLHRPLKRGKGPNSKGPRL